jgi:hypothetical protein
MWGEKEKEKDMCQPIIAEDWLLLPGDWFFISGIFIMYGLPETHALIWPGV